MSSSIVHHYQAFASDRGHLLLHEISAIICSCTSTDHELKLAICTYHPNNSLSLSSITGLGEYSLLVFWELPASGVIVPKVDTGLIKEPDLVSPALKVGKLLNELPFELLIELLGLRIYQYGAGVSGK